MIYESGGIIRVTPAGRLFGGDVCPCPSVFDVSLEVIKHRGQGFTFSIFSENPDTGGLADEVAITVPDDGPWPEKVITADFNYGTAGNLTNYAFPVKDCFCDGNWLRATDCDGYAIYNITPTSFLIKQCSVPPFQPAGFQWNITNTNSAGFFNVVIATDWQAISGFSNCEDQGSAATSPIFNLGFDLLLSLSYREKLAWSAHSGPGGCLEPSSIGVCPEDIGQTQKLRMLQGANRWDLCHSTAP